MSAPQISEPQRTSLPHSLMTSYPSSSTPEKYGLRSRMPFWRGPAICSTPSHCWSRQKKEADAQALLRMFFELVTLFCWLAIAPKKHVARWQEWSSARQLKLHNDAKQFGIEVLTEAELAAVKKPEQPLSVAEMAQEVDDHWPNQSSAFRPHPKKGMRHILTFRGAYTALYRKGSTIIHSDQYAIDRYLSSPLTGSVTVHPREKHSPSPDYPGFAIPLMGFLLLAFAHHFSWPDKQIVRTITDGLIYRSVGSLE